jgi:hypothetical protein
MIIATPKLLLVMIVYKHSSKLLRVIVLQLVKSSVPNVNSKNCRSKTAGSMPLLNGIIGCRLR